METKTPKFKRGTVGAQIAKLVKRFGDYPMGIYILEQALVQSTKTDGAVYVTHGFNTRMLVSESPGYKAARAAEDAMLADLRSLLSEPTGVVKPSDQPAGRGDAGLAMQVNTGLTELAGSAL